MASKSLGTLTVDLVTKVGGFKRGMDEAERKSASTARKIEADQRNLARKLDGIFKSIAGGALVIGAGIAAGVTAVGTQVLSTIDRMDELSKSAQKANMSTESFSALVYAGGLADVQMDTLTKTMGKLARSQVEAADGVATYSEAFERLGLSVTNADGSMKSTDKLFMEFADAFQRLKGSPETMAAGMDIFGRSFQDIIPLLSNGSAGLREAMNEASEFNQVISTETGQAAEAFNDNLTRLQSAASGLFVELTTNLLPAMVEMSDQAVAYTKSAEGQKAISDALAQTMSGLAIVVDVVRVAFNALQIVFNAVSAVVNAFIGTIGAVVNQLIAAGEAIGSFIGMVSQGEVSLKGLAGVANKYFQDTARNAEVTTRHISGAYHDAAQAIGRDAADIGEAINGKGNAIRNLNSALARDSQSTAKGLRDQARALGTMNDAIGKTKATVENKPKPKTGGGGRRSGGGGASGQSEEEKALELFKRTNEAMQEKIGLMGLETEYEQTLWHTQQGRYAHLEEAQKKILLASAQEYDAKELLMEQQKEKEAADKRAADEHEALVERAEQIHADLLHEAELLGKTADEQERLNLARHLGAIAATEQGEAVLAQLDTLQSQRKEMDQQIELMDTVRQSFKGAFTDWISGAKSFKDAFTGMLDQINAKILDMIAENLMSKLFGETGSAGGGMFGGGIGNFFSSLFGGGMATGGYPQAGKFYEVNEQGPEMFSVGGRDYLMMGDKDGQITSHNQLRGMGGGFSQANNFVIQGRIDRRTQEQIAMSVGQRSQVAMRRNG